MATLEGPGVEITTQYVSTSTTISEPLLKGCIIGPCRQLVDVVDTSGNINSDALAGYFEGTTKTFDFPSIMDNTEPITDSAQVYFRYGNSSSLTELDDDEFSVTTESITVSGGAQGIESSDNKKVRVYVQYQGLRKSLAPNSEQNILGTKTGTTIENVADIETYLGPIDTRNPLALAVYKAKENATNTSILAIGVDEVTVLQPDGTSDAYSRALEFLEGKEVYTLVPLSQETDVLSLFTTHVNSMSSSTGKKERIAVLCPSMPSATADETQASGSYGRIINASTFETSGDLSDVSTDDILVVENDSTTYTITSVSDSEVTVSPASLDTSVTTDVVWSIYTPGEAITDRTAVAEAYAAIGTSYSNHRILLWVPEIVEIVVDGVEHELPGYYGAATVAGQIGELAPQQPLTNFPIAGISGLDGSNDYFSATQIKTIFNGGLFIVVQDGVGTLPYCKWQLSSDISSIEKREISITKALDYYSKSLRLAAGRLIGKHVITEEFINFRLSPVITGISEHMVENKVMTSAQIVSIQQSSSQPDRVEIKVRVGVPYPVNFIDITIQV